MLVVEIARNVETEVSRKSRMPEAFVSGHYPCENSGDFSRLTPMCNSLANEIINSINNNNNNPTRRMSMTFNHGQVQVRVVIHSAEKAYVARMKKANKKINK